MLKIDPSLIGNTELSFSIAVIEWRVSRRMGLETPIDNEGSQSGSTNIFRLDLLKDLE